MRVSVVAAFSCSFFCAASTGATPAFLEATSELDGGKPHSAMWNVADDNISTVWCSAKETGKQAINFTFEEPVTITHLGLMFPHGKEQGTVDKANRRPKIVYVADIEHRVEAKFKDTAEMQVLELTPPAKGRRVVVEFDEAWAGATEDAPLCVAEVVLKSKNKEVTSDLGVKAKLLNTPSRKLLHEWHDDLSAPTRTLIFKVDGTFSYKFEPLMDDQKPAKVKGKWTAGGSSVTLEVGAKSYTLQTRLTKIDDGDDHHTELSLSGEAPHATMVETFKPAPLLLPGG